MKPSPTPSLFPLITPSTVPLVRGECSRKGAKHKKRQKKERGKIKKMTLLTPGKDVFCSSRVHSAGCKRPKSHLTDGLFLLCRRPALQRPTSQQYGTGFTDSDF